MSEYFGDPWPSGLCDLGTQVETPTGAPCWFCDVPIDSDDQGTFVYSFLEGIPVRLPLHKECSLRSIVGGIGHLEDHRRWCMDAEDPDGGRTRRQSALEVWEWVHTHGYPPGPGP